MYRYLLKYLGISSLIISLILPSVLNLSLFSWRSLELRKELKARFKSGIPESECTVFLLEALEYQNLDWENATEFFWKDHKYDLIALEVKQGRIQLMAWLDEEESELKRRFHQLLRQHPPEQEDCPLALIDHFKNYFLDWPSAGTAFAEYDFHVDSWINPESSAHLRNLSPPPRLGLFTSVNF